MDMLDLINADKVLKKKDLIKIEGGINITGTLISSWVKGINAMLDLGRSVGTALRRLRSNNLCPISR